MREKGAEKSLAGSRQFFQESKKSSYVIMFCTWKKSFLVFLHINLDHLPTRLLCNKIISNFNDETKLAGTDWMYGFPRRNPRISLRTSENTWAARASGFNRVSVKAFFDLLGSLLNKFKLTPSRIYNWDKTGISTVPNKPTKIFSLKGKKTGRILYFRGTRNFGHGWNLF